MSTHTEHSLWSPDDVDSLENVDKEVQLVSTSTESYSNSVHNGNGSGGHIKIISDTKKDEVASRQSNVNIFNSQSYDNLQAIKCNSSDNSCQTEKELPDKSTQDFIDHPYTLLNQSPKEDCKENEDATRKHNGAAKLKETSLNIGKRNKQDYLEQINKQLTKELDEKNAILALLQENYEHLLFKYAEAQNRIDELRIKFLAEKTKPNYQTEQGGFSGHMSQFFKEEYNEDKKSQKVVTPVINLDEPHTPPNDNFLPVSRPSSLPLDGGLKFGERDLLKATTPTDSEGLSSIITSMSGHSKILHSLDEENQINKKSNYYKYKKNHFVLQENVVSNDPFDKVKNWQNSLPPLEQIETPETTLYNVNNAYSSTDTNYKEISSPKIENEFVFSDESCPLSWREETHVRGELNKTKTTSQSTSGTETSFYLKKSQNAVNECDKFHEGSIPIKEKFPNHYMSYNFNKKNQKRPPLLRCSSLPAYDHNSNKSENVKNGIYIPPLDLNNVTLSDDESYCQQDYYLNKSNLPTASSFISSREDTVNKSIQTPQSFSSCKATISDERVPKQTTNKSTSITPERSRVMDCLTTRCKFDNKCSKTCCSDTNRCNVCGESISEDKSNRFFGSRSNSCESVQKKEFHVKENTSKRSKPPFKRSVSFGSATTTPRHCSHEKLSPKPFFFGLNEDAEENFDAYASSLRMRSEVAIKALTAHVNNS